MGEEGTPVLARASWTLLRADRRPLALAGAGVALASLVGVATAVATELSLAPHVTRYGSAYRTAGFGLPDPTGPPSSVTTLRPTLVTAVVLVTGYLLLVACATLTSAAVVAAADHRLRPTDAAGVDASCGSPLRLVARRTPQLLRWAMLNGILGVVHRLVEKRPVLGMLAGRINGLSWRHATWLAVPHLLAHGTNAMGTLRGSSRLQLDTWGDDALPRTGLGRLGTVLFAGAAVAAAAALPLGAPVAVAVGATVALAAGSLVTALAGTGRAALYRHAAGLPLAGLAAATVPGAFASRNRSVATVTPAVDPSTSSSAATTSGGRGTRHDHDIDVAATLAEVDAVLEGAVALLPRRERLRLRPPGYRRPGPRPRAVQPAAVAEAAGSASAPR